MGSKKKPDSRVPSPLVDAEFQSFLGFFDKMPARTLGLYSIPTKEVKGFKKVSQDEYLYIDDVIGAMNSSSNKVASNVSAKNIQDAVIAKDQFEKLGNLFTEWGKFFSRNAMQAASYSYQHASTYEADVESGIRMEVKGAVEIKEKLEGKRKKRNAAAAATRQATLTRLEAEKKAAKNA